MLGDLAAPTLLTVHLCQDLLGPLPGTHSRRSSARPRMQPPQEGVLEIPVGGGCTQSAVHAGEADEENLERSSM